MKSEFLSCFFCDKEFKLDEVFIAFTRNEEGDGGLLIHCQCLPCAEQRPNKKKEKKGFWLPLQRTLNGYEVCGDKLSMENV